MAKRKTQPQPPQKPVEIHSSRGTCAACGVAWINHPGIADTCRRRLDLLARCVMADQKVENLANKLFVTRIIIKLIANELGLASDPADPRTILKAIRLLKKAAAKPARYVIKPGGVVSRPHK